jgi:hypothetical protein
MLNIRCWHTAEFHVAFYLSRKRIVELCDQANYSDHPEADTGDVQLTTQTRPWFFRKAVVRLPS